MTQSTPPQNQPLRSDRPDDAPHKPGTMPRLYAGIMPEWCPQCETVNKGNLTPDARCGYPQVWLSGPSAETTAPDPTAPAQPRTTPPPSSTPAVTRSPSSSPAPAPWSSSSACSASLSPSPAARSSAPPPATPGPAPSAPRQRRRNPCPARPQSRYAHDLPLPLAPIPPQRPGHQAPAARPHHPVSLRPEGVRPLRAPRHHCRSTWYPSCHLL